MAAPFRCLSFASLLHRTIISCGDIVACVSCCVAMGLGDCGLATDRGAATEAFCRHRWRPTSRKRRAQETTTRVRCAHSEALLVIPSVEPGQS
jgi:hypothetical protein